MNRTILGLDIGGANLKAAAPSLGLAHAEPFALWKEPERLEGRLSELVRRFPACSTWAVTMTGELCDCFPNKSTGVLHIVNAVQAVAAQHGSRVAIWTTQAYFATIEQIRTLPLLAAASNWLALAQYVGRLAPVGLGLLLDIGSTTTDIILLREGQPIPLGLDDPSRLAHGELVYTGVRRTPLCALLGSTSAAEFFATADDAHLYLGHVREAPHDCDSADGRPRTLTFARDRLARMVCADPDTTPDEVVSEIARRACAIQKDWIRAGLQRVLSRFDEPVQTVVVSGSGEFLALQIANELRLQGDNQLQIISLREKLGQLQSEAACAVAVAVLAAESASCAKEFA